MRRRARPSGKPPRLRVFSSPTCTPGLSAPGSTCVLSPPPNVERSRLVSGRATLNATRARGGGGGGCDPVCGVGSPRRSCSSPDTACWSERMCAFVVPAADVGPLGAGTGAVARARGAGCAPFRGDVVAALQPAARRARGGRVPAGPRPGAQGVRLGTVVRPVRTAHAARARCRQRGCCPRRGSSSRSLR